MLDTASFLVLLNKGCLFETLDFLLLLRPLLFVFALVLSLLVENDIAFSFDFLKNFVFVKQVLHVVHIDGVLVALERLANEEVCIIHRAVFHLAKFDNLSIRPDLLVFLSL